MSVRLSGCIIAVLLLMSGAPEGHTQSSGGQEQAPMMMPKPPRRVGNPAPRYEVDAKRSGTNMNSDDALPRSREFIRIDSSYYVGWLYEGAYRHNHAADYLGYKNATVPLERALRLMERDYRTELSSRTHDVMTLIRAF